MRDEKQMKDRRQEEVEKERGKIDGEGKRNKKNKRERRKKNKKGKKKKKKKKKEKGITQQLSIVSNLSFSFSFKPPLRLLSLMS